MKRKFIPIVISSLIVFSTFSCTPTGEGGSSQTLVDVTGISLNESSLTLRVGDSSTLVATVSPNNASNKKVVWATSDETVLSVTQNGELNALSVGNATITATTEDGGFSASCEVTVNRAVVRVQGISLNYDSATLSVGKKMTLRPIFDPTDADNKNVSWSSNKTNIATVVDGVVTAKAVGTVTITATSEDGNFTATCALTVQEVEDDDEYVPDSTDSSILIITAAGEYTLEKNYKQVYVNAPEAEVVINLNGYTIENSTNSPIYVKDCGSIDISATKNKTSYIKDTRPVFTEESSTQGKGAIFVANGDLKLKSTGTLNLTSSYYNGIHAKDDVKVQKLTLNIEAVNNGIRGNDSVTITSGNINIKCGGDGLRTSNSDISSKGNQKGNIVINGGNLTINSWGDAVQAAHNAIFEETDTEAPISFTANTNKYSTYTGEVVTTSTSNFYLKMNSSTYSNGNYTYAAYINSTWYKATYKGTQTESSDGMGGRGGQRTYYFYEINKPQNVSSFTLYRFSGSNVTNFSTTSYNAKSDAKAFNDEYDTVQVSVGSGRINFGNWSNYSSSKSVSCKGIEAENEINIKSGAINLKTYDDALHANNDGSLENGEYPLGNINVSGGSLTINTADDALHADSVVNISGGIINVESSYEGMEGNVVNISGGQTYVVATDDGVNAGAGPMSTLISVTGGLLDVTVPTSGDTDGIDSNGAYFQDGGVVITKGPGTAGGTSRGAAALDTDGTVTLNGGTLIVFGGIEKTPSSMITRTLCSSNTVQTGLRTVSFTSTSFETTLKYNTNGCIVYSDLGAATLR